MNDESARWPGTWVRAGLDLAVLASLTGGALHGYAIAQVLASRGFGVLKGGSLYPVLNRLADAGELHAAWVEGESGPGRREYALTAAGRRRLEQDLVAWQDLTETLTTMTARHERAATGG